MLSRASMRRICLSESSKSRTLFAAIRSCLEDLGTTACRGSTQHFMTTSLMELPSVPTAGSMWPLHVMLVVGRVHDLGQA